MIERHWNAYPVALGEFHRLAKAERVVQDVVVAKGGSLRKPGRAAGELDIDRIIELQQTGERGEPFSSCFAGEIINVVETYCTRYVIAADCNNEPQIRELCRAQSAGWCGSQFRRQFVEHRQIVAALEPHRGD